MKKILSSPRAQLIIIALSLIISSTFLGLTAFLTDSTSLTAHFNTNGEGLFGITVMTQEFTDEQNVIPGEEIAFDPAVSNTGMKSAYVFLEVAVPVDDHIQPIFNYSPGDDWTQVGEDTVSSGMEKRVYGYGTAQAMTALAAGGSTDPLFTSVTLKQMTQDEYEKIESADIVVNAFAIQTVGIESAVPANVWADLK